MQPIEKQNAILTIYHLTSGKRSTLSHFGMEGVVLFGLRSHDGKRSTLSHFGIEGVVLFGLRSHDVKY